MELYEIHDVPGGRLLGKFYVDLFPREGKYGHAASFGLGPARGVPGGYQIPLSVLVVNFEPPQGGKVARLSLNEVDTLFHELWANDDDARYGAAQNVMAGRYTWLEEGIVHSHYERAAPPGFGGGRDAEGEKKRRPVEGAAEKPERETLAATP